MHVVTLESFDHEDWILPYLQSKGAARQYHRPSSYWQPLARTVRSAVYAEIFVTHIENKIRAEHTLPLRTYYSVEEGIYKGRIINRKNGTSLFYDSKEKTTYKKLKKEQVPFKYGAK